MSKGEVLAVCALLLPKMWQAAGRSQLCFGHYRTVHCGHYFLNYFSKEKSSSTLNLPYMELLRTSEQVRRCYTFSDFSGVCVFRAERTTTKCVHPMMVMLSLTEPCGRLFICLFIIDIETSTGETERLSVLHRPDFRSCWGFKEVK